MTNIKKAIINDQLKLLHSYYITSNELYRDFVLKILRDCDSIDLYVSKDFKGYPRIHLTIDKTFTVNDTTIIIEILEFRAGSFKNRHSMFLELRSFIEGRLCRSLNTINVEINKF